jgi:hypothetical protein
MATHQTEKCSRPSHAAIEDVEDDSAGRYPRGAWHGGEDTPSGGEDQSKAHPSRFLCPLVPPEMLAPEYDRHGCGTRTGEKKQPQMGHGCTRINSIDPPSYLCKSVPHLWLNFSWGHEKRDGWIFISSGHPTPRLRTWKTIPPGAVTLSWSSNYFTWYSSRPLIRT